MHDIETLRGTDAARAMPVIVAHGRRIDVGLGWFRRGNARSADFVEHLGGGVGFWNCLRLYPVAGVGGRHGQRHLVTTTAPSSTRAGVEDLMPEINARTDASNMIWRLVDQDTGAENTAIDWTFTVSDRVKIRLVNTMDSDHPMHHPFHVHGAGRLLVIDRDGQPPANLVWKDRARPRR